MKNVWKTASWWNGGKVSRGFAREAIRLGFEILPNSERRIRRLKAK
jgi:hypothetical protein